MKIVDWGHVFIDFGLILDIRNFFGIMIGVGISVKNSAHGRYA